MTCQSKDQPHLETISNLVQLAREFDHKERRTDERFPFFQPAFIKTGDGRIHSAFTREVSKSGVGLLHASPITPGQCCLVLRDTDGNKVDFSFNLLWCRSCGDGWFISGGRFE